MYPTLYPNERIRCRKVNAASMLCYGNIILFYNEDEKRYIVHRIIKIIRLRNGEEYYVTKGDRNLVVDKYLVKRDNVRGVL